MPTMDTRSPRIALILLGLTLVSCKAATKDIPRPAVLLEKWAEFIPGQEHNRPVPDELEGWDWIKLTSGEWLKGEVKTYNKEKLDFESDELGDLTLDWDKVEELVTENLFTIRLNDRTTRTGIPFSRARSCSNPSVSSSGLGPMAMKRSRASRR